MGDAAQALGVSITTLRRWEATGKLSAVHTAGGHRRYDLGSGMNYHKKGLRRLLGAIKREQFPWMLHVTKNAPQMAIRFTGKILSATVSRVANGWFASTKLCSNCGHKLDELSLSVRQWTCPACGATHDRDVNAACNLRNMAVSSTVSACGEESAGLGRKTQVKLASVKQEASSKSA